MDNDQRLMANKYWKVAKERAAYQEAAEKLAEALETLDKYETIDAYNTDESGYIPEFYEGTKTLISNAITEYRSKFPKA